MPGAMSPPDSWTWVSLRAPSSVAIPGEWGQPRREVRSFGTMTRGLLELGYWLREGGCAHLAIESTACFGKPIYNLLEESFTPPVVKRPAPEGGSSCNKDGKDADPFP
jgi:hypothetical protein